MLIVQAIVSLVVTSILIPFMYVLMKSLGGSKESFGVLFGQGTIVLALFLAASFVLAQLIERWDRWTRFGFKATVDGDLLAVTARSRLTWRRITVLAIDMSRVKFIDFDMSMFSPRSDLVFWDRNPETELTFFGTESRDKEAVRVASYSLNAVLDDKRLARVLGDALTSYEINGHVESEIDFHTWMHQELERADGVTFEDGVVSWVPNPETTDGASSTADDRS